MTNCNINVLLAPNTNHTFHCIYIEVHESNFVWQTALKSGCTEFEMRDLTAKFTTDVIGTCAFGLECNSLRDTQSEFRRMGCAVLNSSASLALSKIVRVFFPKVFRALKLRTFPAEVQQFFMGIVKQTIDHRNTNQVRRNDFIQLLLELKKQSQKNETNTVELTEELIAAQVSAKSRGIRLYWSLEQ